MSPIPYANIALRNAYRRTERRLPMVDETKTTTTTETPPPESEPAPSPEPTVTTTTTEPAGSEGNEVSEDDKADEALS